MKAAEKSSHVKAVRHDKSAGYFLMTSRVDDSDKSI